jgi:hypothetical protein
MVLGFLFHGILLKGAYGSAVTSGLMRTQPEMDARFHFLALGQLVFALAAVWIYAYGVEAKPWLAQGIRYGIALWALSSLMGALVGYFVQPWPADLLMKSSAADLVICGVTGVVIAAVYKNSAGIPRSSAARA